MQGTLGRAGGGGVLAWIDRFGIPSHANCSICKEVNSHSIIALKSRVAKLRPPEVTEGVLAGL